MADPTTTDRLNPETPPTLTSLVGGIVDDLQKLMRQELQLAKREVHNEWEKTKTAAASMAAGVGLLAVGGFLLCFMLVHLLMDYTTLPDWACFAIVGGAFAALGAVLMAVGRAKASDINVIPPQTAQTIKENVQWIKNQT